MIILVLITLMMTTTPSGCELHHKVGASSIALGYANVNLLMTCCDLLQKQGHVGMAFALSSAKVSSCGIHGVGRQQDIEQCSHWAYSVHVCIAGRVKYAGSG